MSCVVLIQYGVAAWQSSRSIFNPSAFVSSHR